MLSPKMLKSQIHIFLGGGDPGNQLLMLSPKMLKFQNHIFVGGGGGEGGWWPTFDAESKNAKIPNSHFSGGGGGGQLLMLSPKMLKSQIHIFLVVGVVANF